MAGRVDDVEFFLPQYVKFFSGILTCVFSAHAECCGCETQWDLGSLPSISSVYLLSVEKL